MAAVIILICITLFVRLFVSRYLSFSLQALIYNLLSFVNFLAGMPGFYFLTALGNRCKYYTATALPLYGQIT